MRLVYLESPFASATPDGRERNLRFARACMLDSLARGEAPFVSHALYTQCLDDQDPEQRALGMEAGFAWAARAEATVVYSNLGLSGGMREGIKRALDLGRPVEVRTLEGWDG